MQVVGKQQTPSHRKSISRLLAFSQTSAIASAILRALFFLGFDPSPRPDS